MLLKKLKKNKSELFVYKKTSINDLILFSINSMTLDRRVCTFEGLIKECFDLFPKAFGFSKYPQWPDSRKLDSSLRKMRKSRLITGDPKTFFSLTNNGRKKVLEITKVLRQGKLL